MTLKTGSGQYGICGMPYRIQVTIKWITAEVVEYAD